jgi:hypothetical protein
VVPSGTLTVRPSIVSVIAGRGSRGGRPIGLNVIGAVMG